MMKMGRKGRGRKGEIEKMSDRYAERRDKKKEKWEQRKL